MSILMHGDCLELMEGLDEQSVDLIFCDLPYGCTSCKWDNKIDLGKFWSEILRVKKLHTPIFMTTTTKFGVELINSSPKSCPFRYDLVWVKSSPAGFLSAKKMPMRKHEMVYVFYEKLPFYDLSSHTHKFIKEGKKSEGDKGNECYGKFSYFNNGEKGYDPPLPVSVVKETVALPEEKQIIKGEHNTYNTEGRKKPLVREKAGKYNPPLPTSVVKQEAAYYMKDGKTIYNGGKAMGIFNKGGTAYDPPLPTSVVKPEVSDAKQEVSDAKEEKTQISQPHEKDLYGASNGGTIGNVHGTNYNPPLPTTMLEIKSTRGKHSTEKPVALMEWILKYYSKEGDVVLDPTMGSGSTGVACKNMNRNFIGFELDPFIFEIAVNRIED